MASLMSYLYRLAPGGHTKDYVRQDFALPELKPSQTCTFQLTVVAIMKDEGRYLLQWLEFHLMMGVERFILYDNGSTDDTVDILEPYVHTGTVQIVEWPHFVEGLGVQALAYAHAIALDAGRSKWIAFIDLDEYLFCPCGRRLPSFLQDHSDKPVLVVYWLVFGTSGIDVPTDRLLIDAYRMRARTPDKPGRDKILCNYKSIIQPTKVRKVRGAHNFYLPDGSIGFDELGEKVWRMRSRTVRVDHIRINHYYTKSLAEWRRRRDVKIASGGTISGTFLDRAFTKVHERQVEDTTASAFSAELHARISDQTRSFVAERVG